MFHHKNIRLNSTNYVGRRTYFATLCTHQRRPYFTNATLTNSLIELFRSESAHFAFAIHAYCFMPDHFHFLAEGLEPICNLLALVKSFRIKSSREFLEQSSAPLWQKKFFDHILRPRDSLESIAWYIWLNPVRKNLCSDPATYPFSGSFSSAISRLKEFSSPWQPPWRRTSPL